MPSLALLILTPPPIVLCRLDSIRSPLLRPAVGIDK